jgi:FkbM family methyltransferase
LRGCYIGNNQVLVDLTWGGKMIVNSKDRSLAPELIINGIYDAPLTNFMIKNVKQGQVFVDIGANMGLFTILAGYLVGKEGLVVAFEANPGHYELIKENVAMNYLTLHTNIIHAAIYSESRRLTFFATEKFMGNGSLIEHDEHYKTRYVTESFNKYEIDAVSIDEMFIDSTFINFIKIDIEGGEYHAFLGMKEKLRNRAIGTIIFELNKKMLREDWFAFYNRLEEYSSMYQYDFFTLDNEGNLVPANLDHLFKLDEVPAVIMTLRGE